MKKKYFFPGFLLMVLAAGLCTCGCQSTTPTDEGPSLEARLQEALQGWAGDFGLYGAAAAVLIPGRVDWEGSVGVEDIETREPYKTHTVGRIASATKPFTSTLILQLVDQGLVTLDTPLSDFVPDYPNGENIIVEHLLRHRSGIPEIQLIDGFFILSVLLFPETWITPNELLEWTYLPIPILHIHQGKLIPREPVAEPGGDYHYSQPGYVALGLIIEQLTGNTLADVYQERICLPLGMAGTHLPRRDDPLDPPGYTNLFGLLDEKVPGDSLVDSANSYHSSSWSAGGMISTAHDLVTFLSGMLEGRLFSEAALANATDWKEIEPGDIVESGEYGMGLFRHQHEGYTIVGHDGALPGGGSVMQYIPELDVYIGAVTNTDRDYVQAPGLLERVREAILNQEP